MTLRRTAETRRLGGLLLAAILIASQAAAWVHAGAVAHITCVEHGEAIHAAAPHADAQREEAPVAAATVADDEVATIAAHEHCASGALLRWRALAIAPPAISLVPPLSRSAPPSLARPDALRLTRVGGRAG